MQAASVKKGLEWTLNIGSVLLLCYALVIVVIRYSPLNAKSRQPSGFTMVRVHDKLPLAAVNWSTHRRNLVLAISTSCHFCSESAPFYRELLKAQKQGDWHPIAVLPQPTDEARQYMQAKGYSIGEVHQANFANLGIYATPTLLLVDDHGIVQQQWIGKLTKAYENDIASHLGIIALRGTNDERVTTAADVTRLDQGEIGDGELKQVLTDIRAPIIIDVRERRYFQHGHVEKAINIPLDELTIRAPEEVQHGRPVLLYCKYSPACRLAGLQNTCELAVNSLQSAGFKDVRIIRDPLNLLREAGINIVGSIDEVSWDAGGG